MTASAARAAIRTLNSRWSMSPTTPIGVWFSTDSSMFRSGQSWVHTATPTMAILTRPLTRFDSPSMPNMRLKPETSDSLERSGLIFSSEKVGVPWMRWPPTAAAIITAKTGASIVPMDMHRVTRERHDVSAPIQAHLVRLFQEQAHRNGQPLHRRDLPNMAMASVPPARSTSAFTSVLLMTSPCSRASCSRFCVGSSVCCDGSRSSAMAGSLVGSLTENRRTLFLHALTGNSPSRWRSNSGTASSSSRAGASISTKPNMMLIGMATKKTCSCGIRRARTPSAA